MAKYQKGKIYSIRSYLSNDIYIGSTCNQLSKRLSEHISAFTKRKCSSKEIIKFGDAYIELIENYPCNSKNELNKREGEIIRKNDCVNKNIAGRTQKEWISENKDYVVNWQKKYRTKNDVNIKNQKKEHYKKNKEYIKKKSLDYLNNNREEINRKRRNSRFYKKTLDFIYM